MRQPPVKAMIAFTQEWWGDRLDEGLIARMAGAPVAHIETFRNDWPFHEVFRLGRATTHPELEEFDLVPLEPGETRPTARWSDGTLSALSLLLYTDGLVVSSGYAAPFSLPGRVWEEHRSRENRRAVISGFRALMQLRPLLEADLISFANVDAPAGDVRYLSGNDSGHLRRGLQRRHPDISADDLESITRALPRHRQALRLAGENTVTLVAIDDFEHRLFTKASPFAWRMLVEPDHPLPFGTFLPRENATTTLARTILPDMVGTAEQIAHLRQDDELFPRWRRRLHEALGFVGALNDDPPILQRGRGVLVRELELATRDLTAALSRSGAAAYLRTGSRAFAVGAAKSLATVFTGSVAEGLVGAAVDGAADTIEAVTAERRRRRAAHAVQSLVIDFRRVVAAHSSDGS